MKQLLLFVLLAVITSSAFSQLKATFNMVFPAIKKLKFDYLFIDLAAETPPPVEELIEVVEQETSEDQ